MIKIKTQGCKAFETNVQIIVGFHEIGHGFSGIEKFTCCMNMHGIAKTPFDKLNHEVAKACEVSATKSIKRAAEQYRDNTTLKLTKNRAKFDGAWQKRGHAS